MFSKACEYALKIMIYLATLRNAGKWASLRDISAAIDSPEAFTAKILQQLVKNQLLISLRGPSGGFQLREGQPILLHEVVVAIDGEGIVKNCVLGLSECSEDHPCPMHEKFKAVRDHLAGILLSTSIEDIKEGIIQGNSYLKM